MNSHKNRKFFLLTINLENLSLKKIFILLFYFFFQFIFISNCNSSGINKTSKFETLWKEPANPPPESALLPENNTIPAIKKK